jgi:multidrug efflux pump subunit AcrA (membrane-fusion protein)
VDQRKAETDEAKAEIESKRVEIQSLEARVGVADQQLAQAVYDIDRCTLWAPFTGEVSDVFVEAGGFASVAKPVAHVVMMDPIKVDVSVSAQRAAKLRVGDPVKLYPLSGGEAFGRVYEKSTAADPETRTFRVSILARNSRVIAAVPQDSALRRLPHVKGFFRVQHLDPALPTSPFVVEERKNLQKDAKGHFVWASDELPRGTALDPKRPVVTFRKVRVEIGTKRRNLQGLYVLRALEAPGELTQDWIMAVDPPSDFEGGQALIAIRDWQLRPGQIVPTLLSGQAPKPGLYVPMRALTTSDGGGRALFVEQGGAARRVSVNVIDVVGELLLVEPAGGSGADLLTAGNQVIVDLVHFLQDGEPVRVVKTRELLK